MVDQWSKWYLQYFTENNFYWTCLATYVDTHMWIYEQVYSYMYLA